MILRDDDIFLTESATNGRDFYGFEAFCRVHELLASNGKSHAIAIIAGEIENYPELTDYILKRKGEFIFGLHGWQHQRYWEWEYSGIKNSLQRGRDKIIEVFQETPAYFFAPWNWLSDAIHDACSALQMESRKTFVPISKVVIGETADFACFHYWSAEEREQLLTCLPMLQ